MDIVGTGRGEPQLMMGMPFSDVLEIIFSHQISADPFEILDILIKESPLMVGILSRPNGKHYYRCAVGTPMSEQLAACLAIGIIQNEARKHIVGAAENHSP